MKTTKESMELFVIIRNFLTVYLPSQKGTSVNTITSYRKTLNQFLDYAKETTKVSSLCKLSYKDITRDLVENFLIHMEDTRNWSVSTRNQKLAAIKSFLKYASEYDFALMSVYQGILSIPVKKEQEKPIEFFSETALEAILSEPDTQTCKGIRDLTLMILLYDSAARIQELLDIRIGDLHWESENLNVTLTGKGSKTRNIPLMKKTAEHIEKYIQIYHKNRCEDDFLFYVEHGGIKMQMSQDNVSKLICNYTKRAREKCPEVPVHIYPHMFRHSRAMHLYRNNMPLPLLSEFLGHVNMETTIRYYANADVEMKRKGIQSGTTKCNPLISIESDFKFTDDDETIKRLYGLM